ncbi:hypothetical protein FJZ36_10225 [Candidatus Poribacteria bacterium]|nr:hypothetical protein [Candidatus Poribacteria bacterium]
MFSVSPFRRSRYFLTVALGIAATAGCAGMRPVPPTVRASRLDPTSLSHVGVHFELAAKLGEPGKGAEPLSDPSAAAIASDGTLYVADAETHRILALRPDGTVSNTIGGYGSRVGEFDTPRAITFVPSPRDVLYVADSGGRQVQSYDPATHRFGVLETQNDTSGFAPTALAWDGSMGLLLLDAIHGRVCRIATTGAVVWSYDGFGHDRGSLDNPQAVAPDGKGGAHIADTGNQRLIRLDFAGNLVAETSLVEAVVTPVGVGVDAAGRRYVCDAATPRVVVIGERGDILTEFGRGEMREPVSVALGQDGSVYVVDRSLARILMYKPSETERP